MADPEAAPQLWTDLVPIANLSPSTEAAKSIKSVVALIWPYSASQKSLTLLLAEPDFRLRRKKGQVKVEFRGSSAKEVARSSLGIGDEVFLSLGGAEWVPVEADVRTPRKGVEWKLSFGEKVLIQINRNSQRLALLNLDHPTPPSEPASQSVTPLRSPLPSATGLPTRNRFASNSRSDSWSSPAFLKRTRPSSSSIFDLSYDPFTDEDGDIPVSNRKRAKIGRLSGNWSYIEDISRGEDGTASGVLNIGIGELVEYEAGLDAEVATHVLDRETVSKPAEPIPMPELSTNEQVGHPTTINGGLREVPSQNLLEEENTKEEDEFKLIRDVNVEEGRTEQDTRGNLSSNEVASTNTPAISSTSPMHGKGSKETFSEDPDLIPVGTAERSMLLLPLTPPRPAISQEHTAALAESSREAPALPEAPRLRPLASPGLPLVSPIMGRRSRVSSTVGESQDHLANIEVDKEDEESGIQQFSESFMEASSQDEDSPGLDINSHGSQGLGERPPVNPTQTLSIQQLESGAHTFPIIGADRPDSPHQMVQEDGNISMETWAFVRQSRETSVGYSRESQQDTPSDSESSGHSALDSEVNSQVEWSTANYDRYGVEAAYSDEDDEAQTEEDQELPETVSTNEEESWDEEDRDSDLESQVRADATIARDGTQQDSETARTGAAVIVDLEDDSEDVLQQPQSAVKASTTMIVDLESDSQYPSQVEGSSPCAHALDEIVSDSAAPKSPRFQSLRPEFESSVPKVMGDSEIHEHIAYPKLPEYATEQSHPSRSPLAPDTENELEDHLDPHLRTQLITPNATQQTVPASDHAIEPVQQYHDLPTPQPTQSVATGLPPMEAASSSEHRDSLSQEPKETRTLTTRKITDQTSDAPDGISRWFVPRRPSLVQSESADDDDSSEGTEESEESLESSELGVEDPLHQVERPPGHNSSYIPPSEFSESSITHPLPHEPRPIPPPVGLRTPLSYFAPLAMIPNHFGSTIDVLAITTSTTPAQRSKTGPKDYYTTFHITDPSSESSITPVQIFRPFKEALPLAEKGAAILLRNFKVQSQKHKFILVSTASSAWAVFGKGQTVQVNGPAVEIGAEERGFAKGLREWWMTVGEDFERAREELRSGEGLLEKDIEDHAVNGNDVMGLIRNGNGGLQEPDF